MIIKKLILTSFGKFKNRTIELGEGLNLIYGGNEAGKTTIHKFIEGMFYGFLKPYSKNRQYTEAYQRYLPWEQGGYTGAMIYSHEGKEYRLERNFLKGSDNITLYDNSTGKDLTELLEYDSSHKMYKANCHLKVNSTLFKNTASISQLHSVTDDELADEIGELLVNATETYGAGISYKKAIDKLYEQKAEIGTVRQSRSEYGINFSKKLTLETELRKAEEKTEQNKENYKKLKELENVRSDIQTSIDKTKLINDNEKLSKIVRKNDKKLALESEIETLGAKLSEVNLFTEEKYEEICTLNNEYKLKRKDEENLDKEIEKVVGEINECKDDMLEIKKSSSENLTEEMITDEIFLNQRLREIEKYSITHDNINPKYYKRYKRAKVLKKAFAVTGVTLLSLNIAVALFIFLAGKAFILPSIILGGLTLVSFALWLIFSFSAKLAQPSFDQHQTIMSRTSNFMLMYELDVENLKQKYNCATLDELKEHLSVGQSSNAVLIEKQNDYKVKTAYLSKIKSTRDFVRDEIEILKVKINTILEELDAKSNEDLKNKILELRERKVDEERLRSVKRELEAMYEETSKAEFEQLLQKAQELGIEAFDEEMQNQKINIDEGQKQVLSLSEEISSLKSCISTTESEVRNINEITEELSLVTELLKNADTQIKIYDYAIDKLESLSRNIHYEFSDTFNECVSKMVYQITRGKYDEVKVDEKLRIKVLDSVQNKLVDVGALSGGTIDQLYFAVRFAIMDLIIEDKSIPIIMDDCFLQYDDARLDNILKVLTRIAKRRQLIVFSCRKAEHDMLVSSGIAHNYIELG